MRTTLIDDERGTFEVEIGAITGRLYVHLQLKQRWTPSLKRQLLEDWSALKAYFAIHGHREVRVIIPDNDERLEKFERLMGFEEEARLAGHIVMVQPTE